MAFLTTLLVPQETIDMMKGLGFHQTQAISPTVQWNNHKGLVITHDHHEFPRNIDDVFQMIYCSGFNQGVHEQAEKHLRVATDFIKDILNEHRTAFKVPHRADANLILPFLCAGLPAAN